MRPPRRLLIRLATITGSVTGVAMLWIAYDPALWTEIRFKVESGWANIATHITFTTGDAAVEHAKKMSDEEIEKLLGLAFLRLPPVGVSTAGVGNIPEVPTGVPGAVTGLAIIGVTNDPVPSPLPAFFGAEGYGAGAITNGGFRTRGIQLLRVTNLLDSGAGSYRQAMLDADSGSYTFIIFDTAGTITLNSNMDLDGIQYSGVYLAGHSAPGSGIQLRAATNQQRRMLELDDAGVNDAPHDWIIRGLRLRPGDCGTDTLSNGNCRQVGPLRLGEYVHDVIITESEIQFPSSQNTFGNNGQNADSAYNITLQRSLLGARFAGDKHDSGHMLSWHANRSSIHHSAFLHVGQRTPRARGSHLQEWVNNVIHGWTSNPPMTLSCDNAVGCTVTDQPDIDFIRSFVKATGGDTDHFYRIATNEGAIDPLMFLLRNILDPAKLDSLTDDWIATPDTFVEEGLGSVGADSVGRRRYTPFRETADSATHNVTMWSAQQAWDTLIVQGRVGVYRLLDDTSCDGRWKETGVRDALNNTLRQRAIDNVESFPTTETGYGGFPTMTTGEECTDTDGDGLWDQYELLCSGSTTALVNTADGTGDGYWNIENQFNADNDEPWKLSWNNVAEEDGYHIYRKTTNGFALYDSTVADVLVFTDVGARVNYKYRVLAFNSFGEGTSADTVTAACQ